MFVLFKVIHESLMMRLPFEYIAISADCALWDRSSIKDSWYAEILLKRKKKSKEQNGS